MYLFVGSKNPVKINATINAASENWPDIKVTGLDVPSGISSQPLSDEETREGARNRAQSAFHEGLNILSSIEVKNYQDGKLPILGIGLEGGVEKLNDELWSTVWTCVYDHERGFFESAGARFKIPNKIAKKILAGMEMGEVGAQLMNGDQIKQKQGFIGLLTKNFLDRTEEYTIIIKMALGLWYGEEHFAKLIENL